MLYYNGNDYSWLPNQDPNYKFGTYILECTPTSKKITAFSWDGRKMATKVYGNNVWQDWIIWISDSDLQLDTYTIPKPENTDIFTLSSHWAAYIVKSGKIVSLQLNFDSNMKPSDNFEELFTIPKQYRPQTSVIINYITQKGSNMGIRIDINGNVSFFNDLTEILSNDWICRQCITYVTDK